MKTGGMTLFLHNTYGTKNMQRTVNLKTLCYVDLFPLHVLGKPHEKLIIKVTGKRIYTR